MKPHSTAALLVAASTAQAFLYANMNGHWNPAVKREAIRQVVDCANTILVEAKNETCGSISASAGMTVESIRGLNPALPCINGYTLEPNTLVCVASSEVTEDKKAWIKCDHAYLMQASDTCEGVTTAFGISATNYKILNPTLNCFDTVMMAGNHYCLSGRYPNSTAVFGGAPSNTTSAEVKLSDKCASTLTIQQANQTCIDVVREHANVSVSLLSRWNTGINCWNLPVGSKICIQGDFPDLPVKPTRLPSPSAVPSNTESIGTAVIPVATTTPAESPSPSPPPPPKPAPGSIPSLINQYEFDRAMQNCGIWHDSLYTSMIKGFQAPLASRQELAILLGNIAHESGHFTATREIACRNCNCRYGCWYGRGYIQLTGEGNYQQASWALGIPEIYSNPEVVADSEEVNWAVVQWFWTTAVQWRLYQNGMSLASSVQAVNGYIECGSMGGWAGINSDRARMTQCFSDQFGAGLGWEDYC